MTESNEGRVKGVRQSPISNKRAFNDRAANPLSAVYAAPPAVPSLHPFTLRRFIPDLIRDQKCIWLFPVALVHGKHWKPVLIFLAILAGFFLLDLRDPGYFRHTRTFQEFNHVVDDTNAAAAMWVVVIGALGIGVVRGDKYLRNTGLFASIAVLDSEFFTQVIKGIDRRLRPQDVPSFAHFSYSWFRDRGTWYAGPGSFPSGHMIAAMSIATAFAIRYRHHRWVPWIAYGGAGVVGFSRVTLLSHFPSDVYAAAVLGYVICRYVVLVNRGAAPLAEETDQLPADEVATAGAPR